MKCLTLFGHNLRLATNGEDRGSLNVGEETLLVLLCVEEGDGLDDVTSVSCRLKKIMQSGKPVELPPAFSWPPQKITILPFAHLSEYSSSDPAHIRQTIDMVKSAMKADVNVFVVATNSTSACFADLALFDSVITSKLTVSRQALVNQMKALRRVFSADTIKQVFKEVIGGD